MSSSTSIPSTSRGRRWRRPAALIAAFASSLLGLSTLSQVIDSPGAHAAPGDPGTASVGTWADLMTAMGDTSVNTIYLTGNVQRPSGSTTATTDLPTVGRNLTIDGQNNSLDFRAGGAATAIARTGFTLANAVSATFTLENVDIIRPNGGAISLIGYTGNPSSNVNTTASFNASQNWTVDISDLSTSVAPSSGLVVLPAGTVNFTGNVSWDSSTGSDPATVVVNAATVNISGAGTNAVFRNHSAVGNGDTTTGMGTFWMKATGRTNSFNVTGGAQVTIENLGRGATQTVDMNATTAANTVEQFNMSGPGTKVDILGWGSGTGSTGAVVSMLGAAATNGGGGGFKVTDGAVVNVHAQVPAGRNNGTYGMPCIVQQIDGGKFVVDGEGSQLNVQSDGAANSLAGVIRIRLVGNQLLQVSNLGEMNVYRPVRTGGYTPPAIRFGDGINNTFLVNSGGLVRVENDGNGTVATSDNEQSNGAVEFSANYFTFDVSGSGIWTTGAQANQKQPSAIELIAYGGAAVSARGQTYGSVNVSDGGVFVADGNVNSTSNGIISSGSNFTFTANSPQYYDFANMNPRAGALVFGISGSTSSYTSTNSDIAVWGNGTSRVGGSANATNSSDNPITGNPAMSWTLPTFKLTGTNFGTLVSSNDPTFNTSASSFGSTAMTSYRRISGNNAPPTIRTLQPATNADLYVRATGTVAEGLDFTGRPIWDNEVYSRWQITDPQGNVSMSTAGQSSSVQTEDLYSVQTGAKTLQGTVRYSNGNLLTTGTKYQITQAWRGSVDDPASAESHPASASDIMTGSVTVTDVLPPVPAVITAPIGAVRIGSDVTVSGTWSNAAAQAAAQPNNPDPAVKLTAVVNSAGNVIADCSAGLNANGTWTCDLPASATSSLKTGDKVYFVLTDATGNANPLVVTPIHDTTMQPAPYLTASSANIVAQDFTMTAHDATTLMTASNRDAQLIAAANAEAVNAGNVVTVTSVGIPNPATPGVYPVTFQLSGQPVNATNTITVDATITENPFSAAKSTFTVDPAVGLDDSSNWKVANGTDYYTGTLTANDTYGNLITDLSSDDIAFAASSSHVSVAAVTNNHNGTYTVQYTTTAADAGYTTSLKVKGATVGTTLPIPFKAGPVCVAEKGDTCSADPDLQTRVAVTADGALADDNESNEITGYAYDKDGNPVSGAVFTIATTDTGLHLATPATITTNDSGTGTLTATSAVAGPHTATASISGTELTSHGSPLTLTFTAGAVSPMMSQLTVDKDSTPVAQPITATVTANDASGNPVGAGFNVAFTVSSTSGRATVTGESGTPGTTATCTTQADSTCQVTVTDTKAEPVTLRATINAEDVGGSPKALTFTFGAPKPGPFTCDDGSQGTHMSATSPTQVGASSTATALVTDEYCNPVQGSVVTFTTDSTTPATITTTAAGSFTTAADGKATAYVSDSVAHTVTVSGTYAGPNAGDAGAVGTAPILFQTGDFSGKNSTFTCTPAVSASDANRTGWVIADGASAYTCTVTARDSNDNLLKSLTLTAFTLDVPSAVTQSAVTTDGQGNYNVSFTATIASSSYTAKAAYEGVAVGVPATVVPIPFQAGSPIPPDPDNPTCLDGRDKTNTTASPVQQTVGLQSKVTTLVTDANCNPVIGANVIFQPTGSATMSPTAANSYTTDSTGHATAWVTDKVAETTTVSTTTGATPTGSASVKFNAGAPDPGPIPSCPNPSMRGTNLTAQSPVQVGGESTATAYITDSYCNPVADGTYVAFGVTSPSGTASVTTPARAATTAGYATALVTDNVAETAQVSATIDVNTVATAIAGSPAPVVFQEGTFSGTNSSFTVAPTAGSATPPVADGIQSYTGTVTAKDAKGNLLSSLAPADFSFTLAPTGAPITVSSVTPAAGNGVYTVKFTTKTASPVYTVTAAYTGIAITGSPTVVPAPIPFQAGAPIPPDPVNPMCPDGRDKTNTTADPTQQTAGLDSTVTTLVTDANCNPVPNAPVVFTPSGSATVRPTTAGSYTTGANGIATAFVTDQVAETTTVSAVTVGSTPAGSASVRFIAGAPDPGPIPTCPKEGMTGTNLTALSPVQVGGSSIARAHITDMYCNPVPDGLDVQFAVTSPSGVAAITPPMAQTVGGDATAAVTDTTAETAYVTATIDVSGAWKAIAGSPASVVFEAGVFSGANSTFVVSPAVTTGNKANWVVADGMSAYTGTVTAKDASGNLLSNLAVTDFAFPTSPYVTISSVANNGNGIYTVKFTSTVASAAYSVSSAYQGILVGSPTTVAPIPFKAGAPIPPDPVNPTCSNGNLKTYTMAAPRTQVVGENSLVTTLVTDANCNPVEDAVVVFTTIGSATVSETTSGSFTTNSNGIATANLTDKVAETVTVSTRTGSTPTGSDSVRFMAGVPDPNPVCADPSRPGTKLTAESPVPAGSSSAVSAYITDKYCNPVADGTAVTFGATSPSGKASIAPTTALTSGGTAMAFAFLTDTTAETAQATATIDVAGVPMAINGSPASVVFTSGGIDLGKSTFACVVSSGSSTPPVADGQESYTCTIHAVDSNDNGLSGLTTLTVQPSSAYLKATALTDNGGGNYTAKLTSTVADATYQVTAYYGMSAIGNPQPAGQSVSVPFQAGDPTPGPIPDCANPARPGTGISAMPTTQTVGLNSLVTALVTDANCNPIQGAVVTFATTGSATHTTVVGTTGADGKATANVTDKVAETTTASGSFTSAKGNGSNGSVAVTFIAGAPDPNPVCTDPGRPGTNLTALSPVQVGGSSTVSAYVTDQYCNPVADGTVVTFATTSPSGNASIAPLTGTTAGGTATVRAYLTNQTAETAQVTATIDDGTGTQVQINGSPASVVFIAGDVSFSTSTFQVAPVVTASDQSNWPVADGKASYTGTITMKDDHGNLLSGLAPADFTFATSPQVTYPAVTSNQDGTYTVTFTSTVASAGYTVVARYDNSPIGAPQPAGTSQPIPFKAGPVNPTPIECTLMVNGVPTTVMTNTVLADRTTLPVGGTSNLSAYITDKDCNPIQGASVSFTTTSANAHVATTQGTTDANGRAAGTVTDTRAETVSISGPFASSDRTVTGTLVPASVTFTPGAPHPGPMPDCADGRQGTHLSAAPLSLPVGGQSTATALVTDEYCNPIPGVAVTFTTTGSATLSENGTGSYTTNVNGIATAKVGNTKAETVTVTATDDPVGTVDITFTAGDFSFTKSTFTVAPVADPADTANKASWVVADGTAAYTGTVAAKDANGNPLAGLATSDFTFSPSASTVMVSSVTESTTTPGTYTVKFTSNIADATNTVYANYGGVPIGSPTITLPIPFKAGGAVVNPDGPGCTIPVVRDGTNFKVDQTTRALGASATGNAYVTDNNCNPIAGAQVAFTSDQAGATVTPATLATGADGHAVAAITSSVPLTAHFGASIAADASPSPMTADFDASLAGSVLPGSPVAVTWVPGAPSITGPTGTVVTDKPVISGEGSTSGNAITVKDQDGNTVCTATVQADLSWSCTPTGPLSDGKSDLSATETDQKRNVSTPSSPFDVTIDTTLPTITGPKPGSTVVISTPVIEGTAPDGLTVVVTDENNNPIPGCTSVPVVNGTWSCTPSQPGLSDGAHKLTPNVKDGNGGTNAGNSIDVSVNTTPPTISVPPAGATVVTDQPKISGTGAVAGDKITVTDKDGSTVCTTTVQSDKSWSCTPDKPLGEGDHSLTAVETDQGGNTGTPSAPVTVTVDTSKPTTPKVDDTNGSQITGTGDPGNTIAIKDGNGNLVPGCGNTVVDSTGHFKCVPTTPLNPGVSVTVTAVNAAGTESDPVTVTVGALRITIENPTPKPGDSQTITGDNFNPGETVRLTIDSADGTNVGSVVADANGRVVFTFQIPANLAVGQHTATLTGEQSGSVSDTFQVVGPTIVTGGSVVTSSTGLAAGAGVLGLAGLWLAIAAFRRRDEDTNQ